MTSATETGNTYAVYGRLRHGGVVQLTQHALSFGQAVGYQINLNKVGKDKNFAFFLVRSTDKDFDGARYVYAILPGDRFTRLTNLVSYVTKLGFVSGGHGGYYTIRDNKERLRGKRAVAEWFAEPDADGYLVGTFAYREEDLAV